MLSSLRQSQDHLLQPARSRKPDLLKAPGGGDPRASCPSRHSDEDSSRRLWGLGKTCFQCHSNLQGCLNFQTIDLSAGLLMVEVTKAGFFWKWLYHVRSLVPTAVSHLPTCPSPDQRSLFRDCLVHPHISSSRHGAWLWFSIQHVVTHCFLWPCLLPETACVILEIWDKSSINTSQIASHTAPSCFLCCLGKKLFTMFRVFVCLFVCYWCFILQLQVLGERWCGKPHLYPNCRILKKKIHSSLEAPQDKVVS